MSYLFIPLLAGSFGGGIVAAAMVEGAAGVASWSVLGGSLLLALLLRHRRLLFLGLLLTAGLLSGWTAGSTALRPSLAPCHVSRYTSRDEVRLLVTVADDAVPFPDGSERQEVVADAILNGHGAETPLCGKVELHRPAGLPRLTPGERVLLRGKLRPAEGRRNPGAPSARLRRLSAGVGAVMFARASGLVRLGALPHQPPLSWLRGRIRLALDMAIASSPSRQVVAALVLGDSALQPELRQAYARSGTSHILSVSGLHLSLVALGALGLLRRALLRFPGLAGHDPARLAVLPAVAMAVFYTALSGAAPPAVRSCIMACAGFLALLLQRAPDLLRPLSLAILALLIWDPLNLFLASFQLSFLAVMALGLVLSRSNAVEPAPVRWCGRLLRWTKQQLLASLAVSLLTAPICAHHFHQLSLVGIIANLVAVPLSGFALLPVSLLGALLGAMHPALGLPILNLAGCLAAAQNTVARASAWLPGAAAPLALDWLATAGSLAIGLALLLSGRTPARVLLRRALVVAGALSVVVSVVLPAGRRVEGWLELTFLDVGQGDSTFIRLPDGTSILVDAGGSMVGADPGISQVIPFLRGAGVQRLDLVIMSHPHPDHAGGLGAVLRELNVGELWICWHGEPDPWLDAVLLEARRRDVPVRAPRLLDRGGVRVRPVWPAGYAGLCADPGYSTNDNSLVIRIEHGQSAALLTGDIEADAENSLLRQRPALVKASLLKVAHHGSARSSTLPFLRAVSPRVAVISCGPENHFGFPAPPVLARYAALGIPLLRVDELGAIRVRLSAAGELSWEAISSAVP